MNLLIAMETNSLIERLGWCLFHSVWQIALIALLFGILMRLMKGSSAHARYLVGCVTLSLMISAPAVTGWMLPGSDVVEEPATPVTIESAPVAGVESPEETGIAMMVPAVEPAADDPVRFENVAVDSATPTATAAIAAGTATTTASTTTAVPLADRVRSAFPFLVACWLLGVLITLARPCVGFIAIQRMKRYGVSSVSDSVRDVTTRLALKLGIGRRVAVVQSSLISVPAAIGHWKPLVLLPGAVLTGLTSEQLESVIAHELAHIRRHDFLVNSLQMMVEALLFFHPLVWWVSRRVRQERENCCDDEAVRACGNLSGYAQALLIVDQLQGAVPPTVMAATGSSLVERIRRLTGRSEHVSSAGGLCASVLMLTTAVTAVFLFSSPERGAATADDTPESAAELTEFTFDELIVKKESFAAPDNHTLTIQKDGSYALGYGSNDVFARYQLTRAAIAELEGLLEEVNYLNEPPEEIPPELEQIRDEDLRNSTIRYWKASQRMDRAGLPMASDGTWFIFTLVRDGESTVLSRYEGELDLPPIQPLVQFMDRIHFQEFLNGSFRQDVTDDQWVALSRDVNDPLLQLNLHLDRALGRRNLTKPPLLALDYGRFADRLREFAAGDDPRSASRAQRAIRTISQLPRGDFTAPLSPPIPPAEVDRLATFTDFRLALKSDAAEQRHLAICPDGWYTFWVSGPPEETEHRPLLYRHSDRLPRQTLDRLDELIEATGHTDNPRAAERLNEREDYELTVRHETTGRRIVFDRGYRVAEYEDLRSASA